MCRNINRNECGRFAGHQDHVHAERSVEIRDNYAEIKLAFPVSLYQVDDCDLAWNYV